MGKINPQNSIEQGQLDILITFSRLFKKFKIPFLLTGSLAVAYYGYPRATHDIDFVLQVSRGAKKRLGAALVTLGQVYLQDVSSLADEQSRFYSLYHTHVGVKIDFWLISDESFYRNWARRRETRIMQAEISLVSPEDLILTKLSWCKEIMSERHMRDCVGMWKVQQGKLDEKYLFTQATKLGIESLLKEVIETKEY